MMNNRNYKMITIFTKPPILLRKRIFQIMLFGLIFFLFGQFLMKSDYLIMSLFLSILLLLYIRYTFYKYKGSLDYKIKEFIVHNNLYNSEISAEVGYLINDEQILIRFKKKVMKPI